MAYPSLPIVLISVVIPLVGVPLVYLLSKTLNIHPKPIAIEKPRKELSLAIIAAAAVFVVTFAFSSFTNMFKFEVQNFTIDVTTFAWSALYYGLIILIVIVAMRSTRQKLGTVGINKNGMAKKVSLGATLSIIYLAVSGLLSPYVGKGFAGFSSPLAVALFFFIMVGFCEELFFRGYLQTRLTAYGGQIKGLFATTLIFALAHFATAYYLEASGDLLATLAWITIRVGGPNLILGCLMLKSQSAIPSSIFHVFYDWGIFLWRLAY